MSLHVARMDKTNNDNIWIAKFFALHRRLQWVSHIVRTSETGAFGRLRRRCEIQINLRQECYKEGRWMFAQDLAQWY